MEVKDQFGRTFKTLRVSLTDTCNLACIYCTCGNDEAKQKLTKSPHKQLDYSELTSIIKNLNGVLNLQTIRFTGGEPLLFKDLPKLVAGIKELGIEDLKLTTNGVLLDRLAPSLKAAGLNSINISLDAIDKETFFKMSKRNDINRVLKGIDAALAAGIEVKINAVVMKSLNENQIIPLLEYAFQKHIVIRFLEIMAMGHLYGNSDTYFYSQRDILSAISNRYTLKRLPRKLSSTANYWQTENGNTFGIIANESEPFCSDCNRLRIDSQGYIYGCLSNNKPISITEIKDKEELIARLNSALEQKQPLKFTGSSLSMLHIGG